MKKLLIAVAVILVVIGLAGCGGTSQTNTSIVGQENTGTTNGKVVEVDPKKAEDLINNDTNLVIVDVSGKWAEGHLVNALDVPLDKLQATITNGYTMDASKHYLVYSRDEDSSKKAADMLIQNSFMVVYRLKGGMDAWVAADGYVEK